MSFVVDENLPRRVARSLAARGHQAWHSVDLLGFSAGDRAIWREAVERGAAIVTKDADFARLLSQPPPHCPVILVQIGNCPNNLLISRLVDNLDRIGTAIADGAMLVTL